MMKKRIIIQLALMAALLTMGQAMAAQPDSQISDPLSPRGEMRAPERGLDQTGRALDNGGQQVPSQKTGQMNWSEAASGQQPPAGGAPGPRQGEYQHNPALHGSPQTGYAGTWTDPATGDIITSVIAPTPPPSSSQSYPIYVEPDISGWNGSGNWNQNYTQWPVANGSDGYPTPGNNNYPGAPWNPSGNWNQPGNWNRPPYQPPMRPGYMPYPGHMPPPLPPNFHPGYRPLRPEYGHRPQKPPFGMNNPGGIWNPNQPAWPSEPGHKPGDGPFNIPGWKPFPPEGNRYPPQHAPEFNIPGWKPFPPANNHWQPRPPMHPGFGPGGPGGPGFGPGGPGGPGFGPGGPGGPGHGFPGKPIQPRGGF